MTNAPASNAAQSKPARSAPPADEIEVLIRARYPLIYVNTWEEQRLLSHISRIANQLDKKVYEWSVTTGLVPGGTSIQSQQHKDIASTDPLVALDSVIENLEPALYVFKDFHPFLKGQNMAVIRRLREIAGSLKNTYKTIIIASPIFQMPAELEKDITYVDFDLPGAKEFSELLERIIDEVKNNPKLNVKIDPKVKEQIIHALLGLTLSEAENTLAKTLVQQRGLSEKSVIVINDEKKQIIRKSGLLQYYDAKEGLESIGGLEAMKLWLQKRAVAFTDQARSFGLPAPRGVLLIGVQGCGKSLTAKAVSRIWQLPLLRFDVGQVFGSLVGSSEENIRRAIKVAESVSPVVFWVDEIDKAFRAARGSNTDSGVSARVFGTFLTWMSEKTTPVFVIATANDVTQLPPELLRKGRFDEIFFIDLPNLAERKEIFAIHLRKKNIEPKDFDLERLTLESTGYSGAEIEEAIISSLFDMFYEHEDMTTETLLKSIRQTVPLSKTMSEQMDELRKWAEGRARRASLAETEDPSKNVRKLEIE